ncbi:MAG: hypothetical protein ACK5DG_07930 [Chitinophagaceae bacterium]|jgi:hypothetical protein
MLKEMILENQTALLSGAFIIVILVARIYFWQMEMRELRMFGQGYSPSSKKQKPSHKRTRYADAA